MTRPVTTSAAAVPWSWLRAEIRCSMAGAGPLPAPAVTTKRSRTRESPARTSSMGVPSAEISEIDHAVEVAGAAGDDAVRRRVGRRRGAADVVVGRPQRRQLEQVELGLLVALPGLGHERHDAALAQIEGVGDDEGLGIGRAVEQLAAHAQAGVTRPQLVAGGDVDVGAAVEVAADDTAT